MASVRQRFPFVWRAAPWIAVLAAFALWPAPRGRLQTPAGPIRPADPEHFEAAEPGRGRTAARPTHIPPRGLRDVAWRTAREVLDDRLPSVAGGVTFFTLLALFPAIGVFVSLYGLFADIEMVRQQLRELAGVIPREVLAIVGDQMERLAVREEASLSLAFVVSFLLSIWSANAGMKALFEGLNTAYEEVERRGFIRLTLISLTCTVGAILFLTVVTGLLVAAPLALDWLGLERLKVLMIPLRWAVLLLIAVGAFAMVYRIGPSRQPPRWRWVGPGAIVAAALWLATSLGFSWYVNNIAHYDATYGSLAAVIGFMVWVWASVIMVLIGAELNSELERQTAVDSTTGPSRPLGERGAQVADSVGAGLHGGVDDLIGLLRRRPPSRARTRALRGR